MNESAFGRTLGFKTVLSLVVGTIIGSGIFMRPAEMASLLGSPWLIMAAWIIGGFFTMLTTMILAEVSAMLPEDGGSYAFMRHMYGDFWSYLYGWASFAVVNCAGGAGIAFIFAEYTQHFVHLPSFSETIEKSYHLTIPMLGTIYPLKQFGVKMLTIIVITILSLISYRSTKTVGKMQVVFAFSKVLAIVLLVSGIIFRQKAAVSGVFVSSGSIHPVGIALVIAMVAAINGSLQAFDGSITMLNITGEIKDPGRNIPKSLFWGLCICITIYLMVNVAMMSVLTVDEMAGSALVASDAAQRTFGSIGAGLVSFLICLSVLGTTNSNIMTPPRITFAMARQGLFFQSAGKIHPRFNTPGNAMLFHYVFMVLMVLSGSFYILTDMYIFVVWMFNLFFIVGLFILRKKMPDMPRPYKVWGYPWMPIFVLLFNAFYLVVTVSDDVQNFVNGKTDVMNSVSGVLLTAMGIPLYYYFKRQRKADRGEVAVADVKDFPGQS